MYIRLTVISNDEDSHRQQGIIHAAFSLLSTADMTFVERRELRDTLDWFNEYLPYPSKAQRRVLSHRSVFWFRSSAQAYIKKAWELARLLQSHGLIVDVLKSPDPGNVVFSYSFQVATVIHSWKCTRA